MEDKNDAVKTAPSLWQKLSMYGQLFLSSQTLVDNFLLLYLKKNDAKLSPEFKKERDTAESIIFYTSIVGKVLAFGLITSRLSFLNALPFNPIKDIQTLLLAYGTMYVGDGLPITFLWEKFEPQIMNIMQGQDEFVDLYADNLMNPFKLFYYVNCV
mgnify:FL=1|jgi:hypothetical protein